MAVRNSRFDQAHNAINRRNPPPETRIKVTPARQWLTLWVVLVCLIAPTLLVATLSRAGVF